MFRKQRTLAGLATLAGVLLISAGTAMAQVPAPTGAWASTYVVPPEDVTNTKHNFFANNDVAYSTAQTAEICVFCHTPHGGRTDNSAAPLWNRALPTSGGYTPYNSPNFDGAPGGAQPQGVSLACLSCHDGSIGIDALINAPGSGGFMSTNKTPGGSTSLQLYDPAGGDVLGVTPSTDGSLNDTIRPDCTPGSLTQACFWSPLGPQTSPEFYVANYAGAATSFGMAPFPNLTTDLSDDHPISMQVPANDPQFAQIRANFGGTARQASGITLVSRAPGATFATDDIRDVIRTYPDPANSAAGEFVECASCHNPHTPRPLFLRLPSLIDNTNPAAPVKQTINNNGNELWSGKVGYASGTEYISHNPNFQSAICLSCHQK